MVFNGVYNYKFYIDESPDSAPENTLSSHG